MIVKECLDCGKRSVPFFGMAAPCELNAGSHRRIIDVPENDQDTADRLRATYSNVPSFDRQNFERNASAELKDLLTRIE